MLRVVATLACVASASAFAPSALLPQAGVRAAKTGMRMQENLAVPFLKAPAKLDSSMPGYAGFDPLGCSDFYDVKWLQEAEIKNGRVAMLGVVGLLVPEFFHLPMYTAGATPYESYTTVPAFALIQIFLGCGAVEYFTHKGKISPDNMFDGGRVPGIIPASLLPICRSITGTDVGWAYPGEFGWGKADMTMQTKEIKNGRLAMLAFGGILHQQLFTKMGTIAHLTGGFKPLTF